jgi:hypothetical protein
MKMTKSMVMEPLFGQMVGNISANGRKENSMVKAHLSKPMARAEMGSGSMAGELNGSTRL